MNTQNRFTYTFALLFIGLTAMACGRVNKVYPDRVGTGAVSQQDLPVQIDESSLPAGLFDHSVNGASVELDKSKTNFVFRTTARSNASGSFNSEGTGNRAVLAWSLKDELNLSELPAISFDWKKPQVADSISISIVVDLYCDAKDVRTLQADAEALATQSELQSTGFFRATATLDTAIWQSAGEEISIENKILVPSINTEDLVSLKELADNFPDACLTQSLTDNPSAARGKASAPIFFAMGDDSTLSTQSVLVKRIALGETAIEAHDRRSP